MKELTKEQMLEKYGDVKVKFTSYYKHNFSYQGAVNGLIVVCQYCGGGDIYRHEVSADDEEAIKYLEPDSVNVYKEGDLIESYYD